MGKVSIALVVAVLTASLQCVAACSVLPCDELAKTPAPVEDCHHRPPDSSGQQENHNEQGCGHQTFVSEAAPKASAVTFDASLVATLAVVEQWQLIMVPVAEVVRDWSPPPRLSSTSTSILRL